MKYIFVISILFASACTISAETDEASNYHQSSYYEEYDSSYCYEEEPFYHVAEYCEEYDNALCCQWDTGDYDCVEEWCFWDDICGWEYYETICY